MKNSDSKEIYRKRLALVRKSLKNLPPNGYICSALTIKTVEEIEKQIEYNNPLDLKNLLYPPLFLFLWQHSISKIRAFEDDIDLVVRNSRTDKKNEVTRFLKAKKHEDRLWAGGVFEIFVKSRLLKKSFKKRGISVELDYPLPNGKENDVRIEIEGKVFHLECTVITESDETKEVWDRFVEARKINQKAILVRPGEYDLPNSKSPSPYYDCVRFYAKVYDKVAKDFDPLKCQLSENSANLLLISFYSPHEPLSATSPAVGWAFDELFADQPKSGARLKDEPPGGIDTSLLGWIEFMANELIKRQRPRSVKYGENFRHIVAAPRKIGAIMLFNLCSLKASRLNYNATCRISHAEMAIFENLFDPPPCWYSKGNSIY